MDVQWLNLVSEIKIFLIFFLSQAFAWFSDLLVEHAEIFWSLFAVDMDSTLEMQPPDTWDSFPLFQLLNDYLRNDGLSVLINFCWVVNSGKMYRKPWMDIGCQDDNYQYWKWQGLKWQSLKMYKCTSDVLIKRFFLHSYLSFYFKSLYATTILENALGFKKNVYYKSKC